MKFYLVAYYKIRFLKITLNNLNRLQLNMVEGIIIKQRRFLKKSFKK